MFAWSIGGFSGTYAAMQYPDIKGLILDATFDDVVDLAVAKLPPSWKPLVVDAVTTYFNLNISQQLSYYNGPVLVIRRTQDEIINTNEEEPIKTNRSNDILIKLFKTRFPSLMKDEAVLRALKGWLEKESSCKSACHRLPLQLVQSMPLRIANPSLSLSPQQSFITSITRRRCYS